MRVIFTQSAFRQFANLDKKIQKRINEKLIFYSSHKSPISFAERLQDNQFGSFRFRVGDYRIIFDIDENTIVILKVGHRKDIYK